MKGNYDRGLMVVKETLKPMVINNDGNTYKR